MLDQVVTQFKSPVPQVSGIVQTSNLEEVEIKCAFTNDRDLIFDWLNSKSDYTQQSYWLSFIQFQEFMGATVNDQSDFVNYFPLKQVTKQHLSLFLEHCFKIKNNTPVTVNRKLASLKSLFKHCVNEGYREINPAQSIQSIREDKTCKSKQKLDVKRKAISPEQIQELINHANCYRDRVLFELLYVTGLRIHEALNLTWNDFFHDGKAYYVYILGKGNKPRYNKIPDGLMEKLKKLETTEYLFLSNRKTVLSSGMVYKAIKQVSQKIGIDKNVSAHTFRHSHATHALANGCSLASVRDQLGHSNIKITSSYLSSEESSSDFISVL